MQTQRHLVLQQTPNAQKSATTLQPPLHQCLLLHLSDDLASAQDHKAERCVGKRCIAWADSHGRPRLNGQIFLGVATYVCDHTRSNTLCALSLFVHGRGLWGARGGEEKAAILDRPLPPLFVQPLMAALLQERIVSSPLRALLEEHLSCRVFRVSCVGFRVDD